MGKRCGVLCGAERNVHSSQVSHLDDDSRVGEERASNPHPPHSQDLHLSLTTPTSSPATSLGHIACNARAGRKTYLSTQPLQSLYSRPRRCCILHTIFFSQRESEKTH